MKLMRALGVGSPIKFTWPSGFIQNVFHLMLSLFYFGPGILRLGSWHKAIFFVSLDAFIALLEDCISDHMMW
ncbi:hypothetical protein Prudu_000606 [Prunus dulcis]|uniref:Uncharacterized protein n=1 Tax=Prunus dulcis TaxID=3755 RepID=A0A4Y1QLN8_PRUDU|nr:hypothetical protein Prudu_000606 [Prunus dulcis]